MIRIYDSSGRTPDASHFSVYDATGKIQNSSISGQTTENIPVVGDSLAFYDLSALANRVTTLENLLKGALVSATTATPATGDYLLFRDVSNSDALRKDTIANVLALSSYGWTSVFKTTNQSKTTNTTLANDSELSFSVSANKKYAFRMHVHFACATGVVLLKWAITTPSSPTLFNATHMSKGPGETTTFSTLVAVPGSTAVAASSGTEGELMWDGIFHNGSNAGTFALQWAQNNSDATAVTVYAGSYLEYKQVD